jgi:hypothetical protein
LSGVIGSSRTRFPVAWKIAFAIAAAEPVIPISPIGWPERAGVRLYRRPSREGARTCGKCCQTDYRYSLDRRDDHEVARLEVRFDDNFHIGGGFLASIQRGTSLVFVQARLDQDLWMPVASEIHLASRELLIKGVRENIHITDSDFRRFDVGVVQQIVPPQQ